MSRQSVAPRNLTLTEELERLEQSITLTLQEIDSNFSKSHRIVTTSILPLVEHYGEHSRAVWEASKFWKQFFEASANVSLSGYEELANDEEESVEESTAMRDETTADYTAQHGEEDVTEATGAEQSTYQMEESLLDDAELSGSTPRPPSTKTTKTRYSWHESPYETMKREMEDEEHQTTVLDDNEDSTILFAQHTARLPDIALTPGNVLDDDHTIQQSIQRGKDPLLHRILDKNYRIQATPHKPALRISPLKVTQQPKKETPAWQDDSPMSSPEMEMPKLRSEAFMSPFKTKARERLAAATQGPRTPGVSVQTPLTARKTRDVFADDSAVASGGRQQKYEIDWQSDEDDDIDLYAGMSPPKTIQFALPPSKLLQTPAREASQRIVGDILLDAGADPDSSEYSPSMVKMNEDILNDSF
ncbi:DASH complex subunit Ask1-domain-containing protein [Thelonectria olida]|uniref:DASH complex subunit ASK1 n=1 Tax=Thelonectria olida TaxID=1576542 RepID=A0A9P8WEA2_9HYPO|nr:DASH complex subunit Ask1-domain-containing protein [Thelonectria olida]